MSKNVLLLGRTGIVLDDVRDHLDIKDLKLYSGTNLDDVRDVFEAESVDMVIMGAGIDLETRLLFPATSRTR